MTIKVNTIKKSHSFPNGEEIKFEKDGGVMWLRVKRRIEPDDHSYYDRTLESFNVEHVVKYSPT